MTIDDQVADVVNRLRPLQPELRELIASASVSAVLQVVRYFDDDSGEAENLTPTVEWMDKVPGQHQLLGWHLDRGTLEFLASIGAKIDADEYG